MKGKSLLNRKNFLATGRILKNCESAVRCCVDNCDKRHHTLLHKGVPLKTNGDQHYSSNKSSIHKTFLQIVPVTISNRNRFIHTNTLLDTGSDATLLREIIGLKISTKHLTVTKALLKTREFRFELVLKYFQILISTE